MAYKWCVVPQCTNTSIKSPNKLFVSVPTNPKRRKMWLQLARRDPKSIGMHSNVFMCEDHFDMEKDTKNYMKYKMGFSEKIILADDAMPSKFHCQENRKRRLPDAASSQKAFRKRRKIELVAECLQSQSAIATHAESLQLPNEMENCTEHNLIGSVSQARMKSVCSPTKPSETQPLESSCDIAQVKSEPGIFAAEVEPDPSSEIKPEPMEDQYETPEQNNVMDLEDIKIEIEEHPVSSKLGENVSVFMPCTRKILPKMNMFSIVEYMIENASFKDIDYKTLKTDIDINAEDTIGFVQLHKMADQLTLQATVAFDRVTSHVCVVKYDCFTQTICYTNCECQQAACHHVLAFLMWLHRRSEEQLDNDMSFHLEPLVQQTTFLKAKDLRCDSDTDSVSDDLDIPENVERIQQDIVHEFVRTCREMDMCNSPLYRYLNGNEQLELSLHRLRATWRDAGPPPTPVRVQASNFMHHCTERMLGREPTLQQLAACQDYHIRRELQYARLNGQQIYEWCSMDPDSEQVVEEHVNALLNPHLYVEDEFLEKMKTTVEKQLNIQITKCGIILSDEYPVFCSLPYGFTNSHVIDIVYFENEEQINNYMDNNVLKPHIQFRSQFNMLLAKKEKSYFFIGLKKGDISKRIFIHELKINKKYCSILLKKAIGFWEDYVFKMISPDGT